LPSTESKGPVVSNDQQQSAQPIPQAPPAPPSQPIQTAAAPPPPPPPVAINTVPTVIQEGINTTLYYFFH